MKENNEVRRSRGLEFYKNINKISLVGAIGVGILVPPLAVPALAVATVDVAQIMVIDRVNKKKEAAGKGKEKVIFQKSQFAKAA